MYHFLLLETFAQHLHERQVLSSHWAISKGNDDPLSGRICGSRGHCGSSVSYRDGDSYRKDGRRSRPQYSSLVGFLIPVCRSELFEIAAPAAKSVLRPD